MRGAKKKGTSEDLFDQRTQQVLQGIIDNSVSYTHLTLPTRS